MGLRQESDSPAGQGEAGEKSGRSRIGLGFVHNVEWLQRKKRGAFRSFVTSDRSIAAENPSGCYSLATSAPRSPWQTHGLTGNLISLRCL